MTFTITITFTFTFSITFTFMCIHLYICRSPEAQRHASARPSDQTVSTNEQKTAAAPVGAVQATIYAHSGSSCPDLGYRALGMSIMEG